MPAHEENNLSIVFKINGGLYSVNSKYIETIIQLPKFEPLPESPNCVRGIFTHRDKVITMMDLRAIFGMKTMTEEYDEFANMIDMRKDDHIRWLNELDRCVKESDKFTLATDPHKCAFGHWYDNFKTDNNSVSYLLRKIDDPHKKLHGAAVEVIDCERNCDECSRETCLQVALKRAKEEYAPQILSLLDEAKDIFKSTIYREMVLILSGESRVGIVVDEVLGVETLTNDVNQSALNAIQHSDCVGRIVKSQKSDNLILEIDVPRILACAV